MAQTVRCARCGREAPTAAVQVHGQWADGRVVCSLDRRLCLDCTAALINWMRRVVPG